MDPAWYKTVIEKLLYNMKRNDKTEKLKAIHVHANNYM